MLTLPLLGGFWWVSEKAIAGEPYDPVPFFLDGWAWGAFADLSGSDVSTRPDNYWLITQEGDRQSAISGAQLAGVGLRNGSAGFAFLARGNLAGADLTGTVLRWADLIKTDLSEADLNGANLFWADLSGADLSRAIVEQLQIDFASGDCENALPEGLRRPVEWCPQVTSQ